MADGYDRFDAEGSGGGSFVMGLLTGTVLGAGLGMLFAPKAGSDLRHQLTEQAGTLANSASEGYRRASETANELAGRGREAYDKAREAVSRGADEAQRYARETTGSMSGAGASTPGGGVGAGSSAFPSSSERGTGSHTPASGPTSTPGSGSTGSSSPRRS